MPLFVDIRRGGGSSEEISTEEGNSSENTENSGESDKNVDNSGDLSTSGGSSEWASGSGSEEGESSTSRSSTSGSDDNAEVKSNASDYWYNYAVVAWSGSGTSSDPYVISSAEQLAGLAYFVSDGYGSKTRNCYFELGCDINLSDYYWIPIGGHDVDGTVNAKYYFQGKFNGNGYVIYGLTIDPDWLSDSNYGMYVGLFGYTYGYSQSMFCEIHDINFLDSQVYGYEYVGTVVGYANLYTKVYDCSVSWVDYLSVVYGYYSVLGGIVGYSRGNAIYYNEIHDCYMDEGCLVDGTTYGSCADVGGIVGVAYGYTIVEFCYNLSTVCGYQGTGGIVGYAFSYGIILNCYNKGSVTATGVDCGGIIGYYGRAGSYVCNCYNTGTIEGLYYVGGICGAGQYIYNCFSIGNVTATTSNSSYYPYVGGIAGLSSTCSFCYYSGTVTGYQTTFQWGIGNTTDTSSTTTYVSSLSTYARDEGWFGGSGSVSSASWDSSYPWDFDSIWTIDSSVNGGYPSFVEHYVLTYDSNGDVTGSTNYEYTQRLTKGQAFTTLSSSVLSYSGYTLLGWSTTQTTALTTSISTQSAGASYTGASGTYWASSTSYVYNLAAADTLYAVWKLASYTLTYNSNLTAIDSGNTNTTSTQTVTYTSSFTTLASSAFSCDGYELVGWSTTQTTALVTSFTGKSSGTSFTGSTGTYWSCSTSYVYNYTSADTLYAVWKIAVYYDDDGGYWYFEDGYMPQSYYGADAPSGVSSTADEAYTLKLSASEWAQVEIFGDYAYVTYNSSDTSVSAWFNVEPVRWIISYDADEPTSFSSAVSAYVVTCGYVSTSCALGWSWANSSVLGMSVEALQAYMGLSIANVGEYTYDTFKDSAAQIPVNQGAVTVKSKVAVASVDEIDALGGAYATECTDFVAFLLSGGSSTSSSSTTAYWTRDLACELTADSTYARAFSYDGAYNQGIYVTSDGVLSNATLKNCMGARLSVAL